MATDPNLEEAKAEAPGLCSEAADLVVVLNNEARAMDLAAATSGAQAAWAAIEARYTPLKQRSLDLVRRMEDCEEKLHLRVDEGAFLLGGALWAIGVPSAAAAFIALTGPAGVIAMWGGVGSAAGGGILFGKDLPEVTRLWRLRRRLRVAKEGILEALDRLRLAYVILAP